MPRTYPHFFFFRSVKRIKQEVIFFWLRKNITLLNKPLKIFIFLTLASHNYSLSFILLCSKKLNDIIDKFDASLSIKLEFTNRGWED